MHKNTKQIFSFLAVVVGSVLLSACMFTKHQFSRSLSGDEPSRAAIVGSIAADVVTAPIQAPIAAGKRIAEDARDPKPPEQWKKRDPIDPITH
jgi:hypothetical protein